MKFDIWTFLFQIVNFAVLLFILKRLLYKPVREIIEKRRSLIRQNIEDAEKTKKEAAELKEKHKKELDNLNEQRFHMLEKLKEEVSEDRKKMMSKAKEDADKLIEKEKALFEIEKKRLGAELKDEAIRVVAVFASNLLKDISDEEIHRAVFRKFFRDPGKISTAILKIKETGEPLPVSLLTAYPLDGDESRRFQETVESVFSKKAAVKTDVDKSLIAGIRIKIGDAVYDFSLSGQVEAFKSKLRETV